MNWLRSIRNNAAQIKRLQGPFMDKYFSVIVIILVGFLSFGLGRLSVMQANTNPVVLRHTTQIENMHPMYIGGEVVASRSGTKYYFPWCSGASKIKDSNRVWFITIEKAKRAGYTPSKSCRGLR